MKLSFREAAKLEADNLYEMLDRARDKEDWDEVATVLIELGAFEQRVEERVIESKFY